MVETISAFGYSVPLVVVLVALALVIGLALAVLFWLTVGLSVYRSVADTRRQRVRDAVQSGLLDGVYDPDVDWSAWVADLSSVERDVLESLLDEYLRELDGQALETLNELGVELDIPERSQRQLETGSEYERLYALTWLTLLERPDRLHDADFRPRTPRERAAVARLRYESDDFEDASEGLSLLLEGASSPFTVFGLDTLYRIATDDPGTLFEIIGTNRQHWPESLLVQVLTVCRHLGTSVTTEDLSWLLAVVEHDDKAVREAAVRAFSNVGWRRDVRSARLLERLSQDTSYRVRGAVYEMLARWGDEQALDALERALASEEHPRALLAGTNALVRRRDRLPEDSPAMLAETWAWSRELVTYDRTARQQDTQVSG